MGKLDADRVSPSLTWEASCTTDYYKMLAREEVIIFFSVFGLDVEESCDAAGRPPWTSRRPFYLILHPLSTEPHPQQERNFENA